MTYYYYLHENGDLILKTAYDGIDADLRESDFVRGFWQVDNTDRGTAWRLLVEAGALNANPQRIKELADRWYCNDHDAKHYADRVGIRLMLDGAQWCATRLDFEDLQMSPAGFGETALDAIIALARELGFTTSKLVWAPTFEQLLKLPSPTAREESI